MTVGRNTVAASPASVNALIVFVTRSGIDASRFAPKLSSFKKPLMISRYRRSDCHAPAVAAHAAASAGARRPARSSPVPLA